MRGSPTFFVYLTTSWMSHDKDLIFSTNKSYVAYGLPRKVIEMRVEGGGSSLSRNFRRFSGEASSVVIRLLGVVNLAFTQRLVLARTGYDWKLEAELPLVIAGLA